MSPDLPPPSGPELDGAALLRLVQGLRRGGARHPLTADVAHVGADGEPAHYRLEIWVDGRTATCTAVADGFRVSYAPQERVLTWRERSGAVEDVQQDQDFPVGFVPLAMGSPLALPVWGDDPSGGHPLRILRGPGAVVEVVVGSPDDGGEPVEAGLARIDTELMVALEYRWFGDSYVLTDPHRLVMPDWSSLLD